MDITRATASSRRDEGFTLIELLVVIIIIGVLAAIAVPVFLNQRKKAVDAGLKNDLRSLAMLEETHLADGNANYFSYDSQNPAFLLPDGTRFKTSDPGTQIYVYLGTGGYCVKAFNAGSTKGGTNRIVYDSLAGGFLGWSYTAGTGAC